MADTEKDTRHLTPEQRSGFAHAIHGHPKRDEVFDKAIALRTISIDTPRVAKLLDHADHMDEELARVTNEHDQAAVELDQREDALHKMRWQLGCAMSELVRLRAVLRGVAGQLDGFADDYRDPDGNDCKVAVAHLIAKDIRALLESETK